MKVLVLSLVLLFTASKSTTVYLCMGKYSKRYHFNPNCQGLSNCSTDIYYTDIEEARRAGRTLCGYED